ncbi:MAG: sulfotransferase family 2 domain-containing protein [Kiritimatiellia bacterium]
MGQSKKRSAFHDRYVRPVEYSVKKIKKPVRRYLYKRNLDPLRKQGVQIIHFIHIRKAGGSAVKSAVKKVNSELNGIHFELHPHRITLKDIPTGDKVFFFLRDPVTRFTSAFWSRYRKGGPADYIPWNWYEERAFEIFRTPNELATALSSENRVLRKKAISAMRHMKHVNSFYRDWFHSESYLMSRLPDIIFAGRTETLRDDFQHFTRKLGLEKQLILPCDMKSSNRSPKGESRTLDKEAVKNIQAWYAEDYVFIDLCRQAGKIIDHKSAF